MSKEVDVIKQMREVLQPKGTEPVVRLYLGDSAFFDKEFVAECINELERVASNGRALGEPMTALQRLALHVLTNSALIDVKDARLLPEDTVPFEVNFSKGALLTGTAHYDAATGKVRLSDAAEAEIDARWNTPVTGASITVEGHKMVIAPNEKGWSVDSELTAMMNSSLRSSL